MHECKDSLATQERHGDGSVYDYYRAVEPGASDPPGATGNDGVPVVQARASPARPCSPVTDSRESHGKQYKYAHMEGPP